jgi:hypothetical protein
MGHRWIHIILVAVVVAIVLVILRLHQASGQPVAQAAGNAEEGRLYAVNRCTGCHSVEPETAGTGQFAPDFTVIAQHRSARWLKRFLNSTHKIMPDFIFSATENDDIVAYIVSLKRR